MTAMSAMDWLLDYYDCMAGEHGDWWQQRAEQHSAEFLAGEKPAKWWAWRDVRQRENAPTPSVGGS